MLLKIQNYFSNVKPVTVDGFLYVCIAVFGTVESLMESDETYKYMNPYAVYYIKFISAVCLAGVSALKMFRSTSYSDHVIEKSSGGRNVNTQQFVKPASVFDNGIQKLPGAQ